MKKIIAILLAITTMITSLSTFSGCSKNNNDNNALILGEWLYLISDFFGMENYSVEEPYFKNVKKDNEYFSSFQKAAEWEVLKASDEVSSTDAVLWQEALITLVNAGQFLPFDSSDEEKVDYALKNFDGNIRDYWMKRAIKKDEALIILSTARDLWANKKYDKPIENFKYNEQVKEVENIDQIQKLGENSYVLPNYEQIKEGDIVVLPDENNKFEKTYKKIISASENNSQTTVETADVEDISEIYDELYIQETLIPTLENTVLYDGNGELITSNSNVTNSSYSIDDTSNNVVSLGYSNSGNNIVNCVNAKFSKTFKVEGVEIGIDFDGSSLNGSLKSPELFGVEGLTLNESFEVSDLSATPEIDYSWFKLHSASLRIDYSTKNTLGLKYSSKKKLVAAPGTEQADGTWRYNNGNGKFLTNLKKALSSPMKDGKSKGAQTIASKKTIKICSMNIYSVGVAKICLDVNATFSFDGSVTITVTESGSKGVEYKNGNIRFIKSSTKNAEAQAKAKLEFTLNFGPALYAIGLKKKLVGIEAKLGAGVNASLKAHLADSQMHLIEELDFNDVSPEDVSSAMEDGLNITTTGKNMQAIAEAHGGVYNVEATTEVKLHTDWCLDAKVYGIVKLGLSNQAYLADLLGGKAETSIDICNEKNATFFNIHVDNFDWSNTVFEAGKNASKDNCTLKYVPFDKATDEEDSELTKENETKNNDNEILKGDKLILSTITVSMEKNQQFIINITQIPKNYSINDIEFVSKDNNVAIVSTDGVIKSVDTGNTIVYAKTKDGKYTAMVSVIVASEKKEWTNPLKGVNYKENLDYLNVKAL